MESRSESAFRQRYRQVYVFVRRRVSTDAEAEDVTAEVFADAVAGLERLTDDDGPPALAWLYTVAKRRLADAARRDARRLAEAPAPAAEYGPDVARSIRRALDGLPAGPRAVGVLKLIERPRFAEIAERLGLSEAACKMRCSRGLESLRERLEQEGVEP